MDCDFYETYVMPAHVYEQQKRIACVQFLESQNKHRQLDRLCEIGGFLIRNIDLDWDVKTYNNELQKQLSTCLKTECEQIHKFVLRHITEYARKTYFERTSNKK
jgi:hypothetical protein